MSARRIKLKRYWLTNQVQKTMTEKDAFVSSHRSAEDEYTRYSEEVAACHAAIDTYQFMLPTSTQMHYRTHAEQSARSAGQAERRVKQLTRQIDRCEREITARIQTMDTLKREANATDAREQREAATKDAAIDHLFRRQEFADD